MEFVQLTSFSRIVVRYCGGSGVRHLICSEQFLVVAFAQMTLRACMRDIEVTFGTNSSKLNARAFAIAFTAQTCPMPTSLAKG
jgi:hypothetical protein